MISKTTQTVVSFRVFLWICLCACLIFWGASSPAAAVDEQFPPTGPKLVRAVMCERLENYMPIHAAVVFSIETGQISCYTSFEEVSEVTHTLHKWYRHDDLVTSKRLTLKPPNWSTYSSIQLREADKGPWRVEIYDADDNLLKTLRFSVVE